VVLEIERGVVVEPEDGRSGWIGEQGGTGGESDEEDGGARTGTAMGRRGSAEDKVMKVWATTVSHGVRLRLLKRENLEVKSGSYRKNAVEFSSTFKCVQEGSSGVAPYFGAR
jgi:hypothetical protein